MITNKKSSEKSVRHAVWVRPTLRRIDVMSAEGGLRSGAEGPSPLTS